MNPPLTRRLVLPAVVALVLAVVYWHTAHGGTTPHPPRAPKHAIRRWHGLAVPVPHGWHAAVREQPGFGVWASPDQLRTLTVTSVPAAAAPLTDVAGRSAEDLPTAIPAAHDIAVSHRSLGGGDEVRVRFVLIGRGLPVHCMQIWWRAHAATRDTITTWTSADPHRPELPDRIARAVGPARS